MKFKLYLLGVLLLSIVIIGTGMVYAYSPNYLPGGKNYLSEDNFDYETVDEYSTIDEFLVKPDTSYVLSIPDDFYSIQFSNHVVEFYENNSFHSSLIFSPGDFDVCDVDNSDYYCATFSTPYEVNYMGVYFEDGLHYFSISGFNGVQLEEGDTYTGYEAYIQGSIVDTESPYFTSANKVISYVDSPITINDIQSSLTAYDGIDGDVSASITLVNDNYTANTSVLGTYQCEFSVTDLAGNSTNVIIDVQVVDVLKPVFSNIGVVQAVYPNVYTTEDILSMLYASDNYDGDISSSIVFVDGNYLENSSTVGIYYMNFEVFDSSGNKETYSQNIEVVDLEGPIIHGVDTLAVGYDANLTDSNILELFTCTDNYDLESELSLVVESNFYTNNKDTIGTYDVELSVTDSNGNITYKTLTINVVDQIGPVIYMDYSVIQTYSDSVMELPDFINLMINTNEIDGTINYSVSVMYNSYSGMENIPGVYHLRLKMTDDFGETIDKDFEIKVVDRSADLEYGPDAPDEHGTGYTSNVGSYILGGILTLVLAASNIIWLIVIKKRK